MDEIINSFIEAVEEQRELCDRCLGRIFGSRSHAISNDMRGKGIRVFVALLKNKTFQDLAGISSEHCKLCNGIFKKIDFYAEMVIESVKGYEFETFLIGSRFPREIEVMEREIQAKYGNFGESIRNEFNREVGKALLSVWNDKKVDFKNPEMTIVIDTSYDSVEIYPKPILILGRYRKLTRGIPQTKWSRYPERKKYETSVEEIIAKKVIELTEGKEHLFHGMGREDIDARMLGNGRPFVLEIRSPKKRKINLLELEKEINAYAAGVVEVKLIRFAEWKDVENIKKIRTKKKYLVKVKITPPVDERTLKEVAEKFQGKVIYQRTPLRVLHRRSDLVRERRIDEIKVVEVRDDEAVLEIIAEAGTYIKELIHGDEGRTTPSLAESLKRKISVECLDVVEILDGGEENGGNVAWS